MDGKVRIGIIICHRYHACAGGKCLRATRNREGAFRTYNDQNLELVGYTTCGGCPGDNVEYAPAEVQRNGAQVIYFATGLVDGYPPRPHLLRFQDFIKTKYGMGVAMGTHPIPQSYFEAHMKPGTWESPEWQAVVASLLTDERTRQAYS
jgi:predicted metal-binding protein